MTALTTAAIAVVAILYAPSTWFVPAFAVLMVLCAVEFLMLSRRIVPPFTPKGLCLNLEGLLILLVAFSVLSAVAVYGRRYYHDNLALLYVIAVVKLSDMGGFALGVAFGKHRMCPAISPNKSWEGMFGSVLGSSLMSCAFIPWSGFGVGKALLIGLLAAVFGTAGDLIESKFKRVAGVKDSGTFMPAGLGGLLDMFDSLLFAPAVVWTVMRLA